MNINGIGKFYNTFVKIFIILFVLLVIMPLIIDFAMHFLNIEITPGENSIIVFKNSVIKKDLIYRFIEALKKIRNFM